MGNYIQRLEEKAGKIRQPQKLASHFFDPQLQNDFHFEKEQTTAVPKFVKYCVHHNAPFIINLAKIEIINQKIPTEFFYNSKLVCILLVKCVSRIF